MGMQVEFNWFIVSKEDPIMVKNTQFSYGHESEPDYTFRIDKEGIRLYPIGNEFSLPVIIKGRCIGVASVIGVKYEKGKTSLWFQPLHVFEEDDVIAHYYEDSYAQYKENQERLNNGGKIDLTSKFLERIHKEVKV